MLWIRICVFVLSATVFLPTIVVMKICCICNYDRKPPEAVLIFVGLSGKLKPQTEGANEVNFDISQSSKVWVFVFSTGRLWQSMISAVLHASLMPLLFRHWYSLFPGVQPTKTVLLASVWISKGSKQALEGKESILSAAAYSPHTPHKHNQSINMYFRILQGYCWHSCGPLWPDRSFLKHVALWSDVLTYQHNKLNNQLIHFKSLIKKKKIGKKSFISMSCTGSGACWEKYKFQCLFQSSSSSSRCSPVAQTEQFFHFPICAILWQTFIKVNRHTRRFENLLVVCFLLLRSVLRYFFSMLFIRSFSSFLFENCRSWSSLLSNEILLPPVALCEPSGKMSKTALFGRKSDFKDFGRNSDLKEGFDRASFSSSMLCWFIAWSGLLLWSPYWSGILLCSPELSWIPWWSFDRSKSTSWPKMFVSSSDWPSFPMRRSWFIPSLNESAKSEIDATARIELFWWTDFMLFLFCKVSVLFLLRWVVFRGCLWRECGWSGNPLAFYTLPRFCGGGVGEPHFGSQIFLRHKIEKD